MRGRETKAVEHGRIELNLRDLKQLFNSMDPSPFNEKDLDEDAENFIVSWAREYPSRVPVTMVIHLEQPPAATDVAMVKEAIHHFFRYKAQLSRRDFSHLMRQGRSSLIIGILFLTACLLSAELLSKAGESRLLGVLRESLTIGGWVAMWRPLEIYLYSWWPLRNTWRLYRKLSHMAVEVRIRGRDIIVPHSSHSPIPPRSHS